MLDPKVYPIASRFEGLDANAQTIKLSTLTPEEKEKLKKELEIIVEQLNKLLQPVVQPIIDACQAFYKAVEASERLEGDLRNVKPFSKKFRIWDMFNGCYHHVFMDSLLSPGLISDAKTAYMADQTLDPEQFTGEVDMDGTDIYELDIIEIEGREPSRMIIRFIEGAFCLASIETLEYCADIHYIRFVDGAQARIVGNAHTYGTSK